MLYGSNDTLSHRLVMARDEMVPLQAIIGAREVEAGAVALKDRDGQSVMPLGEAVALVTSIAAAPG